ncbi:MAG: hypothetical protein ACM3PY_07165 [Omnitrophica WOR_2 bacterium]
MMQANNMPSPAVHIRMYKQGLGDCFLLSFPRSNGQPDFQMMIDCGVITGSDPSMLVNAVQDIYNTTNGHLDLVVGTHEHWDHLSGFNQARSIFDKFKIDRVWLAWTEDPTNPVSQSLVKIRAARLAALRTALSRMNLAQDSDLKRSILQVLSFFGVDPDESSPAGGAGIAANGDAGTSSLAAAGTAGTTRGAMQYLRARSDASVHYCNPTLDPPHTLDGVNGVQVYVFGPPVDMKLLKQSDPTKTGHETYGLTTVAAEDSFFAAFGAADGASSYSQLQPLSYPFDPFYQISPEEARNSGGDQFFKEHYGFDEGKDPNAWRRIDNDWLEVTSELALNLDSDTNNTSLVLAFELGEPGSGKVLLFAADAQVGNWLSWGSLKWQVNGSGGTVQTITSQDLLSRAIFYKVGHHGSHNATLSSQGLELMVSDDLVAMIPVVHTMAEKKGWIGMPFPDLLTRLQLKTRGRVMRIDTGLPQRQDASALTDAEWQAFASCVTETPLYIEYRITV